MVSMFSFKSSIKNGTFNTEGITVLLALIGLLITSILVIKQVKGNILWGILSTWVLGIICQLVGLYKPTPDAGWFSLLPDFSAGFSVPSLAPTFMHMDFSKVFTLDFVIIMFAFLFVDMFDTLGTLIGVAKADMLDKNGKLPRIKGALMADAVGTSVGAVLGTSTTTTFVESASGVSEGGRTGLTSITAAILFGLSLFLSPIFLAIPSFATAPALIIVGFLTLTSIVKIRRLQRLHRDTSSLHLHHCNAVHVQYFRRYRTGSHILCGNQPCNRKGKREEDQCPDVCTGSSVRTKICIDLKLCIVLIYRMKNMGVASPAAF